MAEYIEREAALKVLAEEAVFYARKFKDGEARGYMGAKASIEMIPAADVVEVVHAEWEEIDGDYRCTNCHHAPTVGIDNEFRLTNFCPNCGAKMDGESEG